MPGRREPALGARRGGPLGVAVDERRAHHDEIGAHLQLLDVAPLAQLLAAAALGVVSGLIFAAEPHAGLMGAGDLARLILVPLRRVMDGHNLARAQALEMSADVAHAEEVHDLRYLAADVAPDAQLT